MRRPLAASKVDDAGDRPPFITNGTRTRAEAGQDQALCRLQHSDRHAGGFSVLLGTSLASFDDIRSVRYQSTGDGPTVILHHGGGFRLESWELAGWVRPLATDYRVVSFDARGNGESDKPTDPDSYSLDHLVDDVLAVADACEAQQFHYLGWSEPRSVGAWPRVLRTVRPRSH